MFPPLQLHSITTRIPVFYPSSPDSSQYRAVVTPGSAASSASAASGSRPRHVSKMAGAGALQFVLAFFEVRKRLFFSASPAIGCSFRILSLQRAAAALFGSQRGAAGLSQPFPAARHFRAGSMARGATVEGDEWYWGPWAGAARVGATRLWRAAILGGD